MLLAGISYIIYDVAAKYILHYSWCCCQVYLTYIIYDVAAKYILHTWFMMFLPSISYIIYDVAANCDDVLISLPDQDEALDEHLDKEGTKNLIMVSYSIKHKSKTANFSAEIIV